MIPKLITIYDNESFLRQISQEVNLADPNLTQDIAWLSIYCQNNDVMALAAVQIGIPKRIIYLKNTDLDLINKSQKNMLTEEEKRHNEAQILINPVIISQRGLTRYWENCASCLDNMGLVERPYKILLEYTDLTGQLKQEYFEGFKATVLLHEFDHLDGILHIDKSIEIKNMPVDERKKFRQTHGYEIISKTKEWPKKRIRNI